MGNMAGDPHDSRILVDLDGTLTVGAGRGPYDFAPIATGAEDFLRELSEMFDEVVICTARAELGAVKNLMRIHGLAKYINDYTNVKLPAKLIVEDRSVVHTGNLKETLAKIKAFKPHWQNPAAASFESASTQFDLAGEAGRNAVLMAEQIPDMYLHPKGREHNPHVTVLYGIKDDNADRLKKALKGFGSVRARLGKTEVFEVEQKGFDVVKLSVKSEDLKRLRIAVEKASTFETDFPVYVPHVTLAYVKLGSGRKFSGDGSLAGVDVVFDTLKFCSTTDEYTDIVLT